MELKNYLYSLAALLGVLAVMIVVNWWVAPSARPAKPAALSATSTLSVVSSPTPVTSGLSSLPPITIPVILTPTTTIVVTPPPPKKVPIKTPTPVATVAPVTPPVVATPAPVATAGDFERAASTLRAALVNIICYAPAGSGLHSISGSGVFISQNGIILTNAHIAQYFLFADRGVTCKIRTGNPAADRYVASLIYLPPEWIQHNATVLIDPSPSGTGEYDFAFLAITKSLTADSLPAAYPFVSLATEPLTPASPVVIGSYGAQFLEYSQIQSDLFPTLVYGSVKDIFTFDKNTIDVLALGGSAAAQEGSSGGGVVNGSGELAGTIVTSTMQGETSSRQLSAITASYIRREFVNETSGSLGTLLSEPVATAVANFSVEAATLEAALVAHLP